MSAQPQTVLGATPNDADPQETKEWLDALSAVIDREGAERAHFLIEEMLEHARQHSIDLPFSATTGYVKHHRAQPRGSLPRQHPDREAPARLHALERHGHGGARQPLNPADGGDLGGHIGSFASLASMLGAGFNHFWHAESEGHGGDCIYIQGHSAPGVYARAFLEGR